MLLLNCTMENIESSLKVKVLQNIHVLSLVHSGLSSLHSRVHEHIFLNFNHAIKFQPDTDTSLKKHHVIRQTVLLHSHIVKSILAFLPRMSAWEKGRLVLRANSVTEMLPL